MTAVTERSENHGVLRRMLMAREQAQPHHDRPPQLPQAVPLTPARAAANAAGRAAEKLYRLGLQPISVKTGALTLAELPEILPDPALLTIVQGPSDSVGVVALCPETVTALIEIQTLGRITKRPSDRRKLTRSDAMLCVDFVNALMSELATEMSAVEGYEGFAGYRYATYVDDPRPLALMLEDKAYRSLELHLRLGATDTRDARIFLALPDGQGGPSRYEVPKVARPAEAPAPAERRPQPDKRPESMAVAVQDAPIELVGILCRRTIRLKDLRALQPGQLLPLPRVNLSMAQIETPDGQVLASGKFGEADGCHAIRLHATAAQSADQVVLPGGRMMSEPLPDDAFGPDEFRADGAKGAQIDELVQQSGPNRASIA